MPENKGLLLESAYETFLNVSFADLPFKQLENHIADELMGYGSAADEEVYGAPGLRWIIERQLEQVAQFTKALKRKGKYKTIFYGDHGALIVEEIEMLLSAGEEVTPVSFRMTTAFKFLDNQWKIVHFHASVPDANIPEGDAWSIDELKRKNAELEFLVAEKTADLLAKNHELQIQSALERVRTAAMAMRHPDDMLTVCESIAQQMDTLQIPQIRNVQTAILSGQRQGYYMNYQYFLPYQKGIIECVEIEKHPKVREMIQRMQASQEAYFAASFKGKELDEWRQYRKDDHQFPDPILDKADAVYFHFYSIGQGGIGISAYEELSPGDLNLFHRFRNVFALAYQRFKDIEQAELQAREAHIEAALEKVRSRTMAMQKSVELPEAANVLFQQLQALGMPAWSAGYTLWDEDKKAITLWMSSEGVIQEPFRAPLTEDPSFIHFLEAYQRGQSLHVEEVGGEPLAEHYCYMRTLPGVGAVLDNIIEAGFALPTYQIFHAAYFSHGFLLFITYQPVPEAHEIFIRFARVFEQTYTRFLDLKKAEEQTHQARIEVALERVRARAMAMQAPEELVEVAAVMRREMGLLGIEDLETSSIYILTPETTHADCWYAIKDIRQTEAPLVSDHIHLDLNQTWVGREMLDFFKADRQQISIPMKGEQRKEWITYCSSVSKVLTGYYGEVIPERTYHLYKFSNGAIGVAAQGDISAASWNLLQRCASVFSLAYARFKDLTQARIDLEKLKTEKQRAEDALTHLKAVQSQLIQSEKMASLGELTAGIAHEIQNPLNFVNNFSEVNTELIDELQQELTTGNTTEAFVISKSIKENEEKINHHGKRADAIVKGMLQHSRTGSGVKEPTDINALCDEYLRLAYHGLRAKDKSFNATMITDFDPSIGLINIIPQDIGRVILNLIMNAFYAVSAPESPKGDFPFEPTVTITTRRIADTHSHPNSHRIGDLVDGKVEISVADNGPGIPDAIKDKIFQPFFTTKPTGQGTGLGLSLSYDIIKAHGGEISVQTKEGEGTEFIIQLPMS